MRMTRTEFYAKYGSVVVRFSSYYKYTFNFAATMEDGGRILVGYGGDHDAIYRYRVDPDSAMTISDLQPYEGYVTGKSGEEIDNFYDY